MIDHVFLTVSDLDRSIDFYTKALAPLGIVERFDYDGKNGPPGHPDLKGFGGQRPLLFLVEERHAHACAVHVGLVADSEAEVRDAYAAAIAAGATQIHPPGAQLHYDPRYYAAQVKDLDGYSLEFVYKSWQH
jgi:catechol 2,3-dioxygenase-like lactoylglutathione lyase family enzyme